jgi:hypothetical protein
MPVTVTFEPPGPGLEEIGELPGWQTWSRSALKSDATIPG